MSYGSIACFCFICHYAFAYRGPDTLSTNIAPIFERVPLPYIQPRFSSAPATATNVFTHNCSDMNPVSEYMEQDSILAAFTK